MRLACAAATASLAFQGWVTPASAAGADKVDAPAASAVDPAPHAPPQSAQQLADRAFELHAAGNYAGAIATYLKAFDASAAAVTLLNIATIYDRKLHERTLAMEYYRRYLGALDAEPGLVEKANERLTALKQAEEAEVREASRVSATHAPPSPAAVDVGVTSRHVRNVGFVLSAAGTVSLGASLALALLAKCKNDDADAVCSGAACPNGDGVRLARQAGDFATASTVTFLTGLGLASGGLAMILLAPRSSGSPSSSRLALALRTSPVPGGAGLDLRGSF